jgi:hypothetical protein
MKSYKNFAEETSVLAKINLVVHHCMLCKITQTVSRPEPHSVSEVRYTRMEKEVQEETKRVESDWRLRISMSTKVRTSSTKIKSCPSVEHVFAFQWAQTQLTKYRIYSRSRTHVYLLSLPSKSQ